MGANAAWRVMGFVLRVSSWLLFGLCQKQLEKRVLETVLFSLFSTRANHEGGEVFIFVLV